MCNSALALDIDFSELEKDKRSIVKLRGQIEKGDCARFASQIEKQNRFGKTISVAFLFSSGGSLYEGMCIGTKIRELGLITLAPKKGERLDTELCYSACALVWLGGLQRLGFAYGHHPFMVDGVTEAFEEYSGKLNSARADIFAYVRKMNLPMSIAELFLSASSNEFVSLSGEDLDIRFDPVFREYAMGICGASLSDDERTLLRALLENERLGLKMDDPVYTYTREKLRKQWDGWNDCASNTLSEL